MKQQTPHIEKHFKASDTVRDIIIGMSDGLTVPFALAAGLSSAIISTNIIVVAGFAEIAAGCISMGLGGYLAAQSDAEHYYSELRKEHNEIKIIPEAEKEEIVEIFERYGLDKQQIDPVIKNFENNPDKWVEFMMRNELNLEKPNKARARNSGITIALAYLFSGFIPLSPYIFFQTPRVALIISTIVTLMALLVFGYTKAKIMGNSPWRSAWRTVLIGGVAATAAYLIAKAIG